MAEVPLYPSRVFADQAAPPALRCPNRDTRLHPLHSDVYPFYTHISVIYHYIPYILLYPLYTLLSLINSYIPYVLLHPLYILFYPLYTHMPLIYNPYIPCILVFYPSYTLTPLIYSYIPYILTYSYIPYIPYILVYPCLSADLDALCRLPARLVHHHLPEICACVCVRARVSV